MKNEVIIQPKEGVLEIRTGEALPLQEPVIIEISGTIDAVARWLGKRKPENQGAAHILVNRQKKTIELNFDDQNHYGGKVLGKLELHPDFVAFNINSGKYISALKMAEFIKMNRSHFETKSDAMNLVAALKNLELQVDTQRSQATDNRGNNEQRLKETVIKSNVPEKFYLCIPIFKGQAKQKFEVEIYFETSDLSCTLISPEANDTVTSVVDTIIDEQIALITGMAANIVVIEQ